MKKVPSLGYIMLWNTFILIATLESVKDNTQEEVWFNAPKIIEQGTYKVQETRCTGRDSELRTRV